MTPSLLQFTEFSTTEPISHRISDAQIRRFAIQHPVDHACYTHRDSVLFVCNCSNAGWEAYGRAPTISTSKATRSLDGGSTVHYIYIATPWYFTTRAEHSPETFTVMPNAPPRMQSSSRRTRTVGDNGFPLGWPIGASIYKAPRHFICTYQETNISAIIISRTAVADSGTAEWSLSSWTQIEGSDERHQWRSARRRLSNVVCLTALTWSLKTNPYAAKGSTLHKITDVLHTCNADQQGLLPRWSYWLWMGTYVLDKMHRTENERKPPNIVLTLYKGEIFDSKITCMFWINVWRSVEWQYSYSKSFVYISLTQSAATTIDDMHIVQKGEYCEFNCLPGRLKGLKKLVSEKRFVMYVSPTTKGKLLTNCTPFVSNQWRWFCHPNTQP